MTPATGGTTEPPSQRFPFTLSQVVAAIGVANGVIALIAAVASQAVTIVNVLIYVAAVGLVCLYPAYLVATVLFFLLWLLQGREGRRWHEVAAVVTGAGVASILLIITLPDVDPDGLSRGERIQTALFGLGFIVFPIGLWWYENSRPGTDTQ